MTVFLRQGDSTHQILVVDDIADNSILLQTILEAEGYQVDIAESGFVALNKVETAPPDLILLDVMMPGMNGFEVTERIRRNSRLPYIPILLVTGYSDISASQGLSLGADGFIHKPIDFDALLARIREILYYPSSNYYRHSSN